MVRRISLEEAESIFASKNLKPIAAYVNSTTPWLSICEICGSTVKPTLASVKHGQGGCKYCGIANAAKANSIDSDSAFKIMKKAKLKPLTEFIDSESKWKAECLTCGQIVEPRLKYVRATGTGCRFCGIVRRANKRKINNADAIKFMEDSGLTPLEDYKDALAKWKCECKSCGEIVYPRLNSIKNGQSGCFGCGHKRGGTKNRMSEDVAFSLMLEKNIKPIEPYQSVSSPWKSVCLVCKNEVSPRLASIIKGQGGCAYCAGNLIDVSEILARMEEVKLRPLVPYPGAHQKWDCECLRCNRVVSVSYIYIRHSQTLGCQYCSKSKVDSKEAIQVMKLAQLEPLEEYPGRHKGWKSRCLKCLQVVSPAYGSIMQGQGGCKFCAELGIDYNSPAYIYLMQHLELNAIKIGISNDNSQRNRVKTHKNFGWELYKMKHFDSALEAEEIESLVIIHFRMKFGVPNHLNREMMPQGGWTETFDASEIDLPTIWAKVEELSRVKR